MRIVCDGPSWSAISAHAILGCWRQQLRLDVDDVDGLINAMMHCCLHASAVAVVMEVALLQAFTGSMVICSIVLCCTGAVCRFQPNTDITGMMSVEGELVPLKSRIRPSDANGAVEKWLVQVGADAVGVTAPQQLVQILHVCCSIMP